MMIGASAIGSSGNRIVSSEPERTADPRASTSIARLIPATPPTPVSVNPKPSWIDGRSRNRAKNIDQPSTSGSLVSMIATAQTPTPSTSRSSGRTSRTPFRTMRCACLALSGAAGRTRGRAARTARRRTSRERWPASSCCRRHRARRHPARVLRGRPARPPHAGIPTPPSRCCSSGCPGERRRALPTGCAARTAPATLPPP